jgi:hypothetical protein
MKRKDLDTNIKLDVNYILVLLTNQCSPDEIIRFVKDLNSMYQNREVTEKLYEHFKKLVGGKNEI